MGLFVIGAKTIMVVVQVILTIAVVGALIAGFVWVVSGVIQFVGNVVGYEVGSLWGWFKSKLPKKYPGKPVKKK